MDDETLRAAVAQRRAGYEAVARQRAHELRQLSEEDAARIADDLLQALPLLPPVERGSGLVEQQRRFSRARE